MNVMKTMVMIITKKKEDTENSIIIDGNIIKHSQTIKILGTIFEENMKWEKHINQGQFPLIAQLKQRVNSLKLIPKNISQKFAKTMANAILI